MVAPDLTAGSPALEIYLRDGTHVVLAMTDEIGRDPAVEEAVIEIVLSAGETDHDFRHGVEDGISALGLRATVSSDRGPTVIEVGDLIVRPR
jgi:hypothetical protein